MPSQLALLDETETVVTDTPEGRELALAARVEGVVSGTPDLGPTVNALYAQALIASVTDPAVLALVTDMEEGALNVEIVRQAHTASAMGFVLELTAHYFQRTGDTPKREPVLEALATALATSTPPATPCIREQALAALRAQIETALGFAIGRNVDRPVQDVAATIFLDGDQTPGHSGFDVTLYVIEYAVELFAPSSDPAPLATRAEAVLTALRTADRLGGLAVDTLTATLDPETLREAYTGPALAIRIVGTVEVATVANDPLQVGA